MDRRCPERGLTLLEVLLALALWLTVLGLTLPALASRPGFRDADFSFLGDCLPPDS